MLKFSGSTSATMISKRRWMTPHSGFSTEAPGPNGMNVTTAPPSRRFRRDKFRASIPLLSPISFHPSLETGNVTTQSDRRHQRWMWIDLRLLPSPFGLVIRALRSTHQRFQTSCTPPVKTRPCLPPIALDSQMDPALQLFPLLLLAALATQKVYPPFPWRWFRLVL